VVGVITLFVAYQFYHLRGTPGALRGYTSNLTIRIELQPTTVPTTNQNTTDYVTATEALADTLATGPILTSNEFMAQIVQQVQMDNDQITQRFGAHPDLGALHDTTAMSKSFTATRIHNLVTITVNWGTSAGTWAIANAIGEISTSHLDQYLGYVANSAHTAASPAPFSQVAAQVITAPTDPQSGFGTALSKAILFIALLPVSLIIGIALAFLIEYLDDRIYRPEDVVLLLQLPSYGTVPRAPSDGKTAKSITEAM